MSGIRIGRRAAAMTLLAFATSGCMMMMAEPPKDFYVIFFQPGTAELSPDAADIVRDAARAAMYLKAMRIDIAIPPNAAGGANLVESRFTAIQNIIAATGADTGLLERAQLSANAESLPGAADRAEIKLIH